MLQYLWIDFEISLSLYSKPAVKVILLDMQIFKIILLLIEYME